MPVGRRPDGCGWQSAELPIRIDNQKCRTELTTRTGDRQRLLFCAPDSRLNGECLITAIRQVFGGSFFAVWFLGEFRCGWAASNELRCFD
ncbi:MAG: hypothetical protein CMM01_02685 [Rhodopirellula sp.]|nr:hypothetical protein [Rhodopirellula sp.]